MPKPIFRKIPEFDPNDGNLYLCVRCGGELNRQTSRCHFCNHGVFRLAEEGESAPKRMLLGIGPGCWAIALKVEDVNFQLNAHWPRFVPRKGQLVQLWEVGRSAFVDEMGRVRYAESDSPPKLLIELRT